MKGQTVTMEGAKVFPKHLFEGPVAQEVRRTDGVSTQVVNYGTLGGILSLPATRDWVPSPAAN